jgi:hypothetical protein
MGGTAFQGRPHAIQFNSELNIFANSGGNIFKKTWNGSSWSGWDLLGAGTGDPFGLKYGSSEMNVFVRGTNGQIYKNTRIGNSWSGMNSLGGNMSGDPVAIWYNSELSVFAIGVDGQLYKKTWNGSSWGNFDPLT